jgi:molecular chaperone GrpE (heat shock protein)
MKSAIAIVLMFGGTLLWAQTQQQTVPASQQPTPQKHVWTEDELVATRPADFKPSTPDPAPQAQGDAPAVPVRTQEEAADTDSTPQLTDEEAKAEIAKLKAEQADHQKAYDALAEKMDKATEADEKNATMSAMGNEQSAIKKLQKQIDALEHPAPKSDQQPQ